MGNKAQKVQDNRQTYASTIKHPKLYNAKFVKPSHQDEDPYLQIAQQVQSKEIYQKWKKGISKYEVPQNEIQTILLPKQMQFEQKGLCGSSGVIKSRYPVLPFVLSEQIINRAHLKQPFLEKQLWYLLYILNVAGSTAHSRGITLGDVRPENILMSQDGQICVCCLQSFMDEQKNYHKTLSLKLKTFLAPEQMKDLQRGKDDCTQDQTISQSFSIGLSTLAAVLLRNQSELYGIDFSFDEAAFSKELHNLRNTDGYSPILKKIIQAMLTTSPASRLTSQEVVKFLKPFEQQIVNLQSFSMTQNDIPEQIKQKISFQPSSSRRRQQKQFLKVINNNDFNINSRIRYSQSPRSSQVNYPQPSPINSQMRPSVVQYGNHSIPMRQSQYVERPMSFNRAQVLNNPSFNPNIVINPNINQNLPPNFNPNLNPNLNQNFILREQIANNRSPQVTVTQSMYAPAQRQPLQFPPPQITRNQNVINFPQMHRPIQSNLIQPPLTMQIKKDIPSTYQIQPKYTQPHRQIIVPVVASNQYSNPISNISSDNTPSFVNYTSNISSFIPNQYNQVMKNKTQSQFVTNQYKTEIKQYKNPQTQFQYNDKVNFQKTKPANTQVYSGKFISNIQSYSTPANEPYKKPTSEFVPPRLTEYARESYSIKPEGGSDNSKIYQTYQQTMRNIDSKLRQSRRLFPDDL